MNAPTKVLIVDDEPHVRKYLSLILHQLGAMEVFEAANGVEALAAYLREHPPFVLLDIGLPGMDGLEILRRLKVLDPDCVVVMLTSLANRQSVSAALDLGATNYLRKDTPKEEIARALAAAIEACLSPR